MDFQDRLRNLRNEKKLTASQLAAFLGKSEGAIRMWETGKSKPDCDTLIKLAQHFNCTTDYLLGLSEFKNESEFNNIVESFDDLNENLNKIPLWQKEYIIDIAGIAVGACGMFKDSPDIIKEYLETVNFIVAVLLFAPSAYRNLLNWADLEKRNMLDSATNSVIYSTLRMNDELAKCAESYRNLLKNKVKEIIPSFYFKVSDEHKKQLREVFGYKDPSEPQ